MPIRRAPHVDKQSGAKVCDHCLVCRRAGRQPASQRERGGAVAGARRHDPCSRCSNTAAIHNAPRLRESSTIGIDRAAAQVTDGVAAAPRRRRKERVEISLRSGSVCILLKPPSLLPSAVLPDTLLFVCVWAFYSSDPVSVRRLTGLLCSSSSSTGSARLCSQRLFGQKDASSVAVFVCGETGSYCASCSVSCGRCGFFRPLLRSLSGLLFVPLRLRSAYFTSSSPCAVLRPVFWLFDAATCFLSAAHCFILCELT